MSAIMRETGVRGTTIGLRVVTIERTVALLTNVRDVLRPATATA
jgi:hypothetical protein